MTHFTLQPVEWEPRLPPLDEAEATPDQLAALETSPANMRHSRYLLTLAHDSGSLIHRGALFNSVMYAPRGLPRVERELATAIVSIVNGCVYCTSVHARRYAELSKKPEVMQRLFDEGLKASFDPRQDAIIAFSEKLTRDPGAMKAADLKPLRDAGLGDLEILDLIHSIAMFANANRLMQSLGDPVMPPEA
ncbi:peroxidase-related enzyme [Phreatobacter aquaticus]|uniref:Peroxidase-related enzyme n=1 Tax=Phreatobacter aquaticus TaxID=2570229 RepID=A0A4D7QSD9_9HYPH|nr:peroxidase-related enzyme [Phreatobacter aquaticus]QCK88154.1 peroxidase-related enzyme [Phreatobacter aquaticus]